MTQDTRTQGRNGAFATTRWSRVLAAGGNRSADSEQALGELCEQYWPPLYAYVRRRGHDAEDARDLTQAFFVKLLDKRDLGKADPARGRFRSFLLTAMKNFLAGEWRKEASLKRGGAGKILSLDFDSAEETYLMEPSTKLSPEAAYERSWALDLLRSTVEALRDEYEKAGSLDLFDALKGVIGGEEVLPYGELAANFGRSEGALRTAASRLRSRGARNCGSGSSKRWAPRRRCRTSWRFSWRRWAAGCEA